jgi:phosphate-selective porin OprO and OprP
MKNGVKSSGIVFYILFLLAASSPAPAQEALNAETSTIQQQTTTAEAPVLAEYTVEDTMDTPPERKIVSWNDYDLKYFTFNWGVYFIFDSGTAIQNYESKNQIEVTSDTKLRDFRFSFKGKFKTDRTITYTAAFMWDQNDKSWWPRETGIQIAIPELWGNIFIGRQKEGFSLSKISVGYSLAPIERMPANDAMIPIMTDGFKWLGVSPDKHANWNFGVYHNYLPKSPSSDWYDNAVVARYSWVPIHPDDDQSGTLLHFGMAYRWAKISNGQLRLKSKPESYTAPLFLDTGTFPADTNDMVGLEAYYRPGSWLFGTEYFFNKVHSPQMDNPFFHGGEVIAAYIFTGETRPYHDIGGKLGFVFPEKSVWQGGPGALEGLLHFSYSDFDDVKVKGGKFWRITPMLNWYLDDMVRLEFAYGIGVLDRFNTRGLTQFFQLRYQFQIQ